MSKKNEKNEVQEIEQSFKRVAGKYAAKSSGKIGATAIIAGAVVLVAVVAVVLLFFFANKSQPQKIEGNVSVAGLDLTGMNRDEAIEAIKSNLASSYASNTLSVVAGDTTVELTPELTGANLDVKALVDDILDGKVDTQNIDLVPYLNLDKEAIQQALQTITNANASELVLTEYEVTGSYDLAGGTTDMVLVVHMGHPGVNTNADMLYNAVCKSYNEKNFNLKYEIEVTEPGTPDLEKIQEEYGVAPVDAVMDQETFKVTPHTNGVGFEMESAKAILADAQYDSTFEIPFVILEPETTTDKVSDILFRDVLGTYTAKSGSKPGTRDVNLKLSCQKINGTIVNPGEVFDYNKALGERTAATGWEKADGYAGGATVSVYGGGICQASSSLYYCTLIADLEVVTRTAHSYVSSYMPLGMDATVSWGGPEFRFRNNTEYPVRIDAYASGGTVTVTIMGTDTKDYYVEMEYKVLSTSPYETVYKEMTKEEAQAQGRSDGSQMVSGYTGMKVITYKCKYDKVTKELISRTEEVVSTYKRRDRVLVKIVDTTTPTDPTEPIDPSTPSTEPTTPPTTPTTPPTEPTTPPTEPVSPPTESVTPVPGSGSEITEG